MNIITKRILKRRVRARANLLRNQIYALHLVVLEFWAIGYDDDFYSNRVILQNMVARYLRLKRWLARH